MENYLNDINKYLRLFPANTPVERYTKWLDSFLKTANSDRPEYAAYKNIILENLSKREGNHPFLSVITRTQGKRPQELQEVFLCLGAQTDMDFEVVLVGHKLSEEQREQVQALVDEQPEEMRKRIRFLELDYGTRTTPLNFGFAHALGEYAAILDDDDIVLDNWVEAFHKGALSKPGAIMHSYSFEQDWHRLKNNPFEGALRAVARPKATFCNDFFLVKELYMNECPPVCMAFPLYAYRDLGIFFDESLTTTEDWDYIMRVAFVCGVYDTKEATCVYRFWANAENSHTIHGEEEWKKNYDTIQAKFEEQPIVLFPGDVKKVSKAMQELAEYDWVKKNNVNIAPTPSENLQSDKNWKSSLYVNTGMGFSEKTRYDLEGTWDEVSKKYRFYWSAKSCVDQPLELRWDPTETSGVVLEDCLIKMVYETGETKILVGKKNVHNGYVQGDRIFFPLNDPWIMLPVKKGKRVKELIVETKMQCQVSNELLNEILPKQRLRRALSRFQSKL